MIVKVLIRPTEVTAFYVLESTHFTDKNKYMYTTTTTAYTLVHVLCIEEDKKYYMNKILLKFDMYISLYIWLKWGVLSQNQYLHEKRSHLIKQKWEYGAWFHIGIHGGP